MARRGRPCLFPTPTDHAPDRITLLYSSNDQSSCRLRLDKLHTGMLLSQSSSFHCMPIAGEILCCLSSMTDSKGIIFNQSKTKSHCTLWNCLGMSRIFKRSYYIGPFRLKLDGILDCGRRNAKITRKSQLVWTQVRIFHIWPRIEVCTHVVNTFPHLNYHQWNWVAGVVWSGGGWKT